MGMQQVITYYAARPFPAEHPVGSGTRVEYKPGDVAPAGEWGAAAEWLKESGKIFPTATNVWVDEEGGSGPPPDTQARERRNIGTPGDTHESGPPAALHPFEMDDSTIHDESAPVEEIAYPLHEGAGWYRLSDGSRLRGKVNATAAEAALGGSE